MILLDILDDGIGDRLILRSARSRDDDHEVGQRRAGRNAHGGYVGCLSHIGGLDYGMYEWD